MAEMVMNRHFQNQHLPLETLASQSNVMHITFTRENGLHTGEGLDTLKPSQSTLSMENSPYEFPSRSTNSPIDREHSDFWTRHQYIFKKKAFLIKVQIIVTLFNNDHTDLPHCRE
eukprot:TRINITY_DN3095_c0_g1_i1.p1 TRINITY_DN3095_c0_g1~~TRINITY_DN3095_c0_g1_i1.p1  ORF type:complete len:115 (-),score=5.01 TRINITY_DN3095_c0_g1_i1:47-391(-)